MPIIENITERNIMMKARTSLWASLAIAASLGLAGCGGSSDNDDPAPTPPKVTTLPADHGLIDGRDTTIEAGGTLKTSTGTLACPEDGMDCMIKVVAELDGSFTATSTGGEATFTADEPPTPPKTIAEMQMEAFDAAKMAIEAAATEAAAQAAYDTVDKDDITAKQADDLQTALSTRIGEIQAAALKPFNDAKAAIEGAATEDAAQAAYDAVDQDAITGKQAADLAAALSIKISMLQKDGRIVTQKAELARLSGLIDTSDLSDQDKVDAARLAITALQTALDSGSPDLTEEDKAQYVTQLGNANTAVTAAQGGIDRDTRRTTQMADLGTAGTNLQAALDAFAGKTATKDQLDDAKAARTALKAKLDDAKDLSDAEKAQYQSAYDSAAGTIASAETAFNTAETKRITEETEATEEMAEALYSAIKPRGGATSFNFGGEVTATTDVSDAQSLNAGYGDGTTDDTAENQTKILIAIDTTETPSATNPEIFTLSEDKKTTVASIGDWTGKRFYAQEESGDKRLHEAFVYSYVGAPTPGDKFSTVYGLGSEEDNYELEAAEADGDSDGGSDAFIPERVTIPSVTRTAGDYTFEKARDRDSDIEVPGSYHGVAGVYVCLPTNDAGTCSASVTGAGLVLGTTDQTWTFEVSNRDAKVSDKSDTSYASFGWWIEKDSDGDPSTVSVFEDFRGTVGTGLTSTVFNGLGGTATYNGGAVGKYALRSSTGGKNESGHFVATAILEADFGTAGASGTAGDISGTIDNFKIGDAGEDRDWSIALKESDFDSSTANVVTAGESDDGTIWTMGSGDDVNAANASGGWQMNLRNNTNNGDGNVPEVATGTFSSEFGSEGSMVGAFGANYEKGQ